MSSFNPGAPPSVDALFAQWVGGFPADVFFTFDPGTASNFVFGGNPPYLLTDFLAIYPKFGRIDENGNFAGVLPQPAIQMYLNLAAASLSFNRWCELWQMAMGLYTAHFCTLYLRSEGNPGTTAGRIALSGLEKGFTVSKSAGDVSQSQQLMKGIEDWGAWAETSYGTQLVTFARSIGSAPSYIYG